MNIRTKLIICFLGLSMLFFFVGIVFYIQLKNMIEPLTPQSIPQSVEHLEGDISANAFLSRFRYQLLLTNLNTANYVISRHAYYLQRYYLAAATLNKMEVSLQKQDARLWEKLSEPLNLLDITRNNVINLMKNNQQAAAIKLILDPAYQDAASHIEKILNHRQQTNNTLNEKAVVSVKMSTHKTLEILNQNLNTTLILLLDTVVISLFLAYIASRAISNPINTLRNDIEKMHKKNLNVPIQPSLLMLTGEVGDLARAFENLLNKLRSTTVLRDELLIEIGRRKQSEEELRKTTLILEESNRDLEQFAYTASHDLRAPLRGIDNLAKWILADCNDILPETSRQHLDLLTKRIYILQNLIAGILEYSRIGRTNSIEEEIDLNRLLPEIIDSLAPPSHLSVKVIGTLPSVVSTLTNMTQIFMNLINNAIKFNDKHVGLITIKCDTFDTYYRFEVSDNGPGIPEQYQQQIFQIFQTVQTENVSESSGIGLAIVRKIVESHGDKVWVKSNPNEGSTFYFTWMRPRTSHFSTTKPADLK